MSQTTTLPAPPADGVQFDKAEFADKAPASACIGCQKTIDATYYQINERVVCPGCKDEAAAALTGGSSSRRFLRALAWGGLGAFAGAAIWMTITRITGWEIGLVAIVVGLLVGWGVRKGADGRGGWAYQSLAIALTYMAIVATYVPDVHKSLLEAQQLEAVAEVPPDSGSAPSSAATDGTDASANFEVDPSAGAVSAALALPLYLMFLLAVASALPFLALPENLIGVLIIGFALFEAWKMNKRTPLVVSGPFEVTRDDAPTPAPATPQ